MARQKTDQLNISYDKDADVLYVTEGKPCESVGEIMEDGVIVRRDPKTKKIIGFTLLDFTEHFSGKKPQQISLNAHFSLL